MDDSLEDAIRRRAYQLYLARGGHPGFDEEDWLQAERELLVGERTRRTAGEDPAAPNINAQVSDDGARRRKATGPNGRVGRDTPGRMRE